jgi:hypothetical protein
MTTADNYLAANAYTAYTCSDALASRSSYAVPCLVTFQGTPYAGEGFPKVNGCIDLAEDDAAMAACGAALQQCCYTTAQRDAQMYYDECIAGCPKDPCESKTCPYGCDSNTGECKPKPCQSNLDCKSYCEDANTIRNDGWCGGDGQCVFATDFCQKGCNVSSGACNNDPCENKVCEPICENWVEKKGVIGCDPNTGECKYQYYTQCKIGCDPDTHECTKSACEINGCPDKCEGSTMKTWGECNKDTGICDYKKTEPCPLGCDPAINDCKQKTCEGVTCPDVCSAEENKVFSNMSGSCAMVDNKLVCNYVDRLECKEGACNESSGHCMEICDNGIDDNGDYLIDCDDPQCKGITVPCACYKMSASGSSTLVKQGFYNNPEKLNIIFVGQNYYPEGGPKEINRTAEFMKGVKAGINGFKEAAPFSLNLDNIDFYYTRVEPSVTKYPLAVAAGRCLANPLRDYYIYLDYSGGDKGECGNAPFYSHELRVWTHFCAFHIKETVLHEFGHAFGGLWDEYSYGTNLNPANAFEYIGRSLSSFWNRNAGGKTNCCLSVTKSSFWPWEGCKEYFQAMVPDAQPYMGCTSPNWQRPSPYSIMWDADTYHRFVVSSTATSYFKIDAGTGNIYLPWYYNPVSQVFLQSRLEHHLGTVGTGNPGTR